MKKDLSVAKELLKTINENTAPWRKSWTANSFTRPYNPITKTVYRGTNAFTLFLSLYMKALTDHEPIEYRYSTFNQLKKEGLSLKRGCHGKSIFFYGSYVKKAENDDEEDKVKMCLKCYTVFNYKDVVFPAEHKLKAENNEFDCDKVDIMEIVKKLDIKIIEGNTLSPCYNTLTNVIQIPNNFTNESAKYSTLLHEIVHWTKNNINKCKRNLSRAHEELVAELGSFMLCHDLGIEYIPSEMDNYYAYLKSWLSEYNTEEDKLDVLNDALIHAGKACKEIMKVLEN